MNRNRPSNKRHNKQNVAAALSHVPPPLAKPKLIVVKNRQHRCHTAKGDFSVSLVILYKLPLSISHMTFQQYFNERRVKHYRGGKVGKRGFLPKPARISNNPLYDAQRRHTGRAVSGFRENQAKALGGAFFSSICRVFHCCGR